MSIPPKPTRRRKNDQSEVPVWFLPEGNRAAKYGYICLLTGFVPGMGLIAGLPAMVLGMIGLRIARCDPARKGIGHAWVSRLLGGVQVLCSLAGYYCLMRAYGHDL